MGKRERIAFHIREIAEQNRNFADQIETCSVEDLASLISVVEGGMRPISSEIPPAVRQSANDIGQRRAESVSRVILGWIHNLNETYPKPLKLSAPGVAGELAASFVDLLVKYGFLKRAGFQVELSPAGRLSLIRAAAAESSVYRFLSDKARGLDEEEPHALLLDVLRSYFQDKARVG